MGIVQKGRFTTDDLLTKDKKNGGLAYHFLTNIWDLRKTSIRALSHSALRNSGFSAVLSEQFDILFPERGNGRVCRVDAGPLSAREIKGHFERVKINVSYQFQPLKKCDTFQPDTF